ncbi:MAG: acetoacetate--CoA ligase [Myxococcota bacterium]
MSREEAREGDLLWTPSRERVERARMNDFARWLEVKTSQSYPDFAALHAYSTTDLSGFWRAIAEYFDVRFHSPVQSELSGSMPDARWFTGASLNYAEQALRRRDDHVALVFRSETGEREQLTYAELVERVSRVRAGMRRLGVGRGDRVAALLPNRIECVVAFLAAASLGAIWSSCSPEFGVTSVLDRFRQIEPKLLLAVDHYVYGGKLFDRSEELAEIRAGLPGLRNTVCVGKPAPDALSFDELESGHEPLAFDPVPFEHPLWILYSSGTTGLPKAIVQSHGGILLEHLKSLALHLDLGEDDRFFWFTTTGWMMWNMLVSGLTVGATVVLYDGSPAAPDLYALWKLAEEEGVTYFGTSAPYLLACQKAKIEPKQRHSLGKIHTLGTTGAPLPASGFGWVYEAVSSELLLGSLSGGTDVCTAFVLSCPLLPVVAGEIQCAGLGASVEAFDDLGQPLLDAVGELVLTKPLPSMPIQFWNDPGDVRRRESYFSTYPGVWRHGDWVKRTPRGGYVISGRSDSTLNRGGVRMGTSEFYRVVEELPEIADSLVVDTGSLDDDASGKLWLFVALKPASELDAVLTKKIKDTLRTQLSPRHVPDEIRAVAAVPRTLNGKKLEVPVKRILLGTPPEKAASAGTLSDPRALEPFVALAHEVAAKAKS